MENTNQPVRLGTTIQTVGIEPFFNDTDNVYYSVVVLGKRATQIGQKVKAELAEKLAEFSPPGDSLEEIVENREQIEIAKVYEALPKPTLVAIEEFLNNELEFQNNTDPFAY
jgi:DNA-directed RNA polymerase subunit K/omega